ncbi:MAG: hypothetical protein WCQ63_05525 [Methanomethylophilus sp.]|nr:hypothetical protein [Methanomethylophilus sp.]
MTDRLQQHTNWVCVFFAAVLLVMTILAIPAGGRHMYEVITGIVCSLFCLLPALFFRKKIMRLPLWFTFIIEAAICMHGLGVLLLQYDLLVYYDTVTHTLSSFVITVCVFFTLLCVEHYGSSSGLRFTPAWTAMLVFVIMMAFGGYWEAFEYLVDNLTGTSMQYSPFDTVRDMLSNAMGSVLSSTFMYFYLKHHDNETVVRSFALCSQLERLLTWNDCRGNSD